MSARAPQLTGTSGPCRPDSACTARASSSLPDPVSPSRSTGTVDDATRASAARLSPYSGRSVVIPGIPDIDVLTRSTGVPGGVGSDVRMRKTVVPSSRIEPSRTMVRPARRVPSRKEPFLELSSSTAHVVEPGGTDTMRACRDETRVSGTWISRRRPPSLRSAESSAPRPIETSWTPSRAKRAPPASGRAASSTRKRCASAGGSRAAPDSHRVTTRLPVPDMVTREMRCTSELSLGFAVYHAVSEGVSPRASWRRRAGRAETGRAARHFRTGASHAALARALRVVSWSHTRDRLESRRAVRASFTAPCGPSIPRDHHDAELTTPRGRHFDRGDRMLQQQLQGHHRR